MVKGEPKFHLELRKMRIDSINDYGYGGSTLYPTFVTMSYEFAFPKGAKDENLMKNDKDDNGRYIFPIGEDNKPTFCRTAAHGPSQARIPWWDRLGREPCDGREVVASEHPTSTAHAPRTYNRTRPRVY